LPHRVYLDDMYGGRWAGYGRYLRKGLRKFLGGTSEHVRAKLHSCSQMCF